MGACDRLIGVKHITIRFTDCNNGAVYGPYKHELSSDEQPTWWLLNYVNEEQPGGFARRAARSMKGTLKVNRLLFLPLRYYQGDAGLEVQVEYINGSVVTALEALVTGEEMSDTREVAMTIVAPVIDEVLAVAQPAA